MAVAADQAMGLSGEKKWKSGSGGRNRTGVHGFAGSARIKLVQRLRRDLLSPFVRPSPISCATVVLMAKVIFYLQ
jgi:hypothetical protein